MGPGAKPAVPALREALRDKDISVRLAAARSLRILDPGSAPATGTP